MRRVEDDEPLMADPYTPLEWPETERLVRCNRCGAVCIGDVVGQTFHDVWHSGLDHRIEKAARWRPAPRYGGKR